MLLLPTITHIHLSVIPVLVGDGTLFLDGRAHKTIYDGAMAAAGHGATVVRFRHDDPGHLEELLRTTDPAAPRVIAMDGVNSMTGNAPDLAEFSRIAQTYDCLLYVDDAHGFGVIGERSRDEPCSYGVKGNSVFRHQGVPYDGALLVAGMSKAYSSLLAFIALPTRLKDALKVLAPPYLYSGPSPVASLATALVGLEVNRHARRRDPRRSRSQDPPAPRSDLRARHPHPEHVRVSDHRDPARDHQDELDELGRYLFDHGQYATLAAYPLVPKNEVGFRIQVTAANTDEQIDELIEVLELAPRSLPARAGGRARAAGRAAGGRRLAPSVQQRAASAGVRPPNHPPSHTDVRGGDVATLIRRQEHVRTHHVVGRAHATEARRERARSEPPASSDGCISVMMVPGLTVFTRIPRAPSFMAAC